MTHLHKLLTVHFTKVFSALCLSTMVGCGGGGSDVGSQSDGSPIATAEVFGASQATSGEIEVRSGKDVLLSGFNSDGIDDPLLSFQWQQVNTGDYPVEFYERTRNSTVFTAPQVPLTEAGGVLLQFELTVIDADGKEATDQVGVRVKPAYDSNKFLLNPNVDENFVVIVAAAANTALANEISFTLNMMTTASWTDRDGNQQTINVDSKNFSGSVAAGQVLEVSDARNTFYKVPIPLLDADEINVNFQGATRGGRLEFEHVENAVLNITLSLEQQSTGAIDVYLARDNDARFELLDISSIRTAAGQLNFSDEWLRQNLQVESRRSANNYYDCIDPETRADTLTKWIEQAGFNAYPDSVVHTSYVNNYDLNFGRDMYVRKDDNGNVYSYVTNYPSLENIFSGRNEFAIVVMEYSAAPTGNCGDGTFEDDVSGKKIVKFYSYVPDTVTGEYVRAPSMNFDGRGERMVPGVCVACHYGDTNSDQFNAANLNDINASAADLDSSFIPWDLDALLYTQSNEVGVIDPVYSSAEISDEITVQYSRESQEEAFRLQNQMVLDTFTHHTNNLKRFETPIKMLHGFYGNSEAVENLNFGSQENPLSSEELTTLQSQVSTLPNNPFDSDYVQSGWHGQEDLYRQVFVRNCRLCHAQVGNQAIDFDSYDEFINNKRLIPFVFEQGTMPLSRLTMDRFWIDFYGNSSPAEILRNHLNSDTNPNNDVPLETLPGYPVANISPSENAELAADVIVDFGSTVLFDASDSLFTNAYEWSVDGNFVSNEEKFVFTAGEPGTQSQVSFIASNTSVALVSNTVQRSVLVNNNVPNPQGVPAQSVNESASVAIDIFNSLCPGQSPDSESCRSVFGDIRNGEVPSIEITGAVTNGTASVTDATSGIVTFTSTAASFLGAGEFNFTLTDSFGESSSSANVSITVNSLDGPEIVGPDTCSMDAISSFNENSYPVVFGSVPCLNPSANDTVADGLSLQVISVGSPTQTNSTVSVSNSGVISYTPSRFFVGQDSFSYTVQDSSLSQRTNSGTVVVTINATETFSSLLASDGVFGREGATGCGSCHVGNTAGAPDWRQIDNVRLAATNTEFIPYDPAEITLAEPTTTQQLLGSVLFQNSCNSSGGHTGGNRLCNVAGSPTSISDLNSDGLAILRWLEEGAVDN